MDCHDISYLRSWSPGDQANRLSIDFTPSLTMRLTLLFFIAPSFGQKFHLSNPLLCDTYKSNTTPRRLSCTLYTVLLVKLVKITFTKYHTSHVKS